MHTIEQVLDVYKAAVSEYTKLTNEIKAKHGKDCDPFTLGDDDFASVSGGNNDLEVMEGILGLTEDEIAQIKAHVESTLPAASPS